MSNPPKPTIADVAKKARVSVSSVSRVLNQDSTVSADIRTQVEKAVAVLEYKRIRKVSRDRKKLYALGVVVPEIENPYFLQLLKGIEGVARRHAYNLILSDSENKLEFEQEQVKQLKEKGVDGLIVIPASSYDHSVLEIVEEGYPCVLLDRYLIGKQTNSVACDNKSGVYQAIKYLLALGHKEIVYVDGPKGISVQRDRFEGYKQAFAEAELEIKKERIIQGDFSLNSACLAMSALLEREREFTAVFASNDMMAFGALKALSAKGLRVPEDVSLMGYDDIPLCSAIGLTTVHQPSFEMGKEATILLFDLIHERVRAQQHVVLMPSLVIRDSCIGR
jgi:DNA-binding LacI/PurR family transcriptional regulator